MIKTCVFHIQTTAGFPSFDMSASLDAVQEPVPSPSFFPLFPALLDAADDDNVDSVSIPGALIVDIPNDLPSKDGLEMISDASKSLIGVQIDPSFVDKKFLSSASRAMNRSDLESNPMIDEMRFPRLIQ